MRGRSYPGDMATIETAVRTLHLLFAGVWAGGVVFVTLAVLGPARAGDLGPEPLESMIESLRRLSRASALVLLLTGGHLAGTGYTADSLLASTAGNLVVAMVVLWLALTALVEVGAGRLADGLAREKVREPAREATRFLQAAAVVALALLVVGGVLA